MHKIKIIGAKCELITPENKKVKFSDLYDLIFYLQKHKLEVSNLEVLPLVFREILDN
jgi:hypothetical protein